MISFTSFLQKNYQRLPKEIAIQTGAKVHIVVPPFTKELWSGRKKYLEKKEDSDYQVHIIPTYFYKNLHFTIFKHTLATVLQTYQPHIIDCENEPFNLGSLQIVRYKARYAKNSKLVLHASQNIYKKYPYPFNVIEKYVFRNTDAILVRNQRAFNILRKKDFTNTLKVITHGVDTEVFKPEQSKKNLSPEGKPVIGYVGALERQKGVSYLLRAVTGLDCMLVIIGNGSQCASLQKEAKELNINVLFLPPVNHDDIVRMLNGMDIFVLPSVSLPNLIEKFGRVLIEAMACGVPVIGSSSGEIPNVINDKGLIFREGSSD
jgi:glycosyltransferase involved in cell wall biosynthesis